MRPTIAMPFFFLVAVAAAASKKTPPSCLVGEIVLPAFFHVSLFVCRSVSMHVLLSTRQKPGKKHMQQESAIAKNADRSFLFFYLLFFGGAYPPPAWSGGKKGHRAKWSPKERPFSLLAGRDNRLFVLSRQKKRTTREDRRKTDIGRFHKFFSFFFKEEKGATARGVRTAAINWGTTTATSADLRRGGLGDGWTTR